MQQIAIGGILQFIFVQPKTQIKENDVKKAGVQYNKTLTLLRLRTTLKLSVLQSTMSCNNKGYY
jgi:hypothetical protein